MEKKKQLIDNFKSLGAEIVQGELENIEELTKLMQGSDTVISVLGKEALTKDLQFNVLQAALNAGVRHIVPSEYGLQTDDERDFLFGPKVRFRHHIINLIRERQFHHKPLNLSYTLVFCGGFYEWFFGKPTGFDYCSDTLLIPGDGDLRFSAIHYADVGIFLPEILLDPASQNRSIHIFGDAITHNEARDIFEEVLGKKFKAVYQSCAELRAFVEAESDAEAATANIMNQSHLNEYQKPANLRYPTALKVSAHSKRVLLTLNELFDNADVIKYCEKGSLQP
jgi:uncharacterized protein YbjT (DUF2867 family)